MELNKDLTRPPTKSRWGIAYGIFFLVLLCVWIIYRITQKETFGIFECLFFGAMSLTPIRSIIEGMGISIERLIGEAYILINSELISLKSSVFAKKQFIYWDDIKSIEYSPYMFKIQKTDNTNFIIQLAKFSYVLKKEIIDTIEYIAKEKNVRSDV